eukprot:CAMPEP_0119557760 /NCGR_PEP_ID=MMETSP1352-20130426/9313_1 /TAXON_ID=265584 /ORGANISM="Stauroneis constricta, Strain CCMP1120" /LENGTH=665 /DNA_ID=CAMNT_0007604901 /DNA_START=113 /DNA_END=2113 /DNA_ORIENTATION=+
MSGETTSLLDKSAVARAPSPTNAAQQQQSQPATFGRSRSGSPTDSDGGVNPSRQQPMAPQDAPSGSFLPHYAGYGAVSAPPQDAINRTNSNDAAFPDPNNGSTNSEQMTAYAMAAAQYEAAAAAAAANWAVNSGAYPPPAGGYHHPPNMAMGSMYPPHPAYSQPGYAPIPYQQQPPPQPFPMGMAGGYPPSHNPPNPRRSSGSNQMMFQQHQPPPPPPPASPPPFQQHQRQEYPPEAANVEQFQQTMLMAAARTRSYSNDSGLIFASQVNLKPSKTKPPPVSNLNSPHVPPSTISTVPTTTSPKTMPPTKGSGIPNIADIFSDSHNKDNITSSIRSAGPLSPKIFSGSSSKPPKVRARMVRTNSSNDVGSNRNQGSTTPIASTGVSKSRHRRASSDIPGFRHGGGGGGGLLPPINRKQSTRDAGGSFMRPAPSSGNSVSSGSRQRSLSASGLRMHRRVESSGNLSAMSTATSPAGSIVSNIAKSAMFGGVCEETGHVQMHFPFEAVRLFMTSEQQVGKKALGKFFIECSDDDSAIFANYQQVSLDLEMEEENAHTPLWESMSDSQHFGRRGLAETNPVKSGKADNKPPLPVGKENLLPPPQYVLSVDESIYRRILGEISESQNMPCGLFFCGHHEDVAYPSIWIAVVIVSILFLLMAYASMVTSG